MTVLDLSQYDLPLGPACLKAAGVTGAILGVYHPGGPEVMRSVGQSLQAAGVNILGWYGLPYFGSPYGENRDIGWAIDNALATGVSRVWIDCEIDAAPIGFTDDQGATPARRISVLKALVARIQAAGLTAGVYTAPWWWRPDTGDSRDFSDLPLWFANYGANDGSLPPYTELPDPFGGWTRPAVHQYTSTLSVCGRGRDADYVLEDDMPDPRIDKIIAALGGEPAIDAWNALGNSLLAGYAIEQRDQDKVEAEVAKLSLAALPDHQHVPGGVAPA